MACLAAGPAARALEATGDEDTGRRMGGGPRAEWGGGRALDWESRGPGASPALGTSYTRRLFPFWALDSSWRG